MWALLLLLAISPLPLGSNRPFFWALSALAVGIVGTVYFLHLQRKGLSLRFPVSSIRIQAVTFVALCAYLVMQMLPIAALVDLDVIASSAELTIHSKALSVAPGATFLMCLRIISYGVFFFLILQLGTSDHRRAFMLDAILTIIAAYAVIGLYSLQAGDTNLGLPKWAYLGSATGTFVNRNSYATYLAFGICIAAAQLAKMLVRMLGGRSAEREAGDTVRLVSYSAIYLLLLTTVVATNSRMGIFVSVAGTFVALILTAGRGSGRFATVTLAGLFGSILAIGSVLAVFGATLLERLGGVERSAGVRSSLYEQVIEMISLRPLVGTGGGTFDLAFPLFHDLPVNPDLVWDKAHNTYLALWSELGLVFGSVPIVIFALGAIKLVVALASGQGSQTAPIAALAAIVVGAMHSLVDFSLEIQANTFVFLALTALGLASGGAAAYSQRR